MAMFLNILNRLRIGRAQPGGGGGVAGGERANVPALDAGLTWEAGGSRRTGPRKWSGSTASAIRASRSSLSTSISSRTTASAGATPALKLHLQWSGVVPKAPRKGAHRRKRERRPLPGHDAAPGLPPRRRGTARATHGSRARRRSIGSSRWMTRRGRSIRRFSSRRKGAASTFRALKEVFVEHGLPVSLFTDRGAHDSRTTKGEIDRGCSPQVGRAVEQLGVEPIGAFSPHSPSKDGRSSEHPLARRETGVPSNALCAGPLRAGVPHAAGPTAQGTQACRPNRCVGGQNAFIGDRCLPAHNARFAVQPAGAGSAFTPIPGVASRRDPVRRGGAAGRPGHLRVLPDANPRTAVRGPMRPHSCTRGSRCTSTRRLARRTLTTPPHRPLRPERSAQDNG